MSTDAEPVQSMSYPDYCTYCFKKYNNRKCLLPYALASSITLPDDVEERVMELTQLHCSFRSDSLRYVVDRTLFHMSSSDLQSGSVFGAIHNWVVENPDLPPSNLVSQTASTRASGVPLNEESPPDRMAEHTALPEPPESVETQTLAGQPTEAPAQKETTEPGNHQELSPLTQANLDTLVASQWEPPRVTRLDLHDATHLARDLVIAVTTAVMLRKTKRAQQTLADLRDTVSRELETKHKLGPKYTLSDHTKLDHPIALSRELIATHSDKELSNWQTGKQVSNQQPASCYLNFKQSNPFDAHSPESKRLDNYLILFAKRALQILSLQKENKKQLLTMVKHLLTERKLETSYEWLRSSDPAKLYKDDPLLVLSENIRLAPNPKASKPDTQKLVEAPPPLSLQGKKVMDNQFAQVYLHLKTTSDHLLRSKELSHLREEAVKSMTEYVLRHCPIWDKPHFAITPAIAERAATDSKVNLSAFEVSLLAFSLNDIVKHLRDSQN